jgi:hypothetical protein
MRVATHERLNLLPAKRDESHTCLRSRYPQNEKKTQDTQPPEVARGTESLVSRFLAALLDRLRQPGQVDASFVPSG